MTQRRITWRGVFVPVGTQAPDLAWIARPAFPRYRPARRTIGTFDLGQAKADARNACYLARIAGADGGIIYLDGDLELTIEYLDGWVNVVDVFGFRPGLCCSHETLTGFVERGVIDPTEWVFRAMSTVVANAREERAGWWVH